MGREFELKFRSNGEKNAAIRGKYGEFSSISMETTYYDTPDRVLRARHWTLRRRFENGVSVCTVKTPAPNGGRGEWEVQAGDIMSAVPVLIALGAPEELLELTQNGVVEVCAARFTRLAKKIPLADGSIELALDEGHLLGGGKALPLAEVEVELKSGSDMVAIGFARLLAAEFQLAQESKSKLQRALELTYTGET